ncbi:MAG: hypothetical protein SF172_11040 [Burkholderiales bacterium]|nr:hypothetical protein [Burkholderiales bacterium]
MATNYVLRSEEDRQDLASELNSFLASNYLAGPGFEYLEEKLDGAGFRGRTLTSEDAEKLLQIGVTMVPCDWGYCMYRSELSACEGTTSTPNILKRSPEVCVGCKNFAINETSIDWWLSREAKYVSFMKLKNIEWQGKLIAKRRLESCRKALDMGKIKRLPDEK